VPAGPFAGALVPTSSSVLEDVPAADPLSAVGRLSSDAGGATRPDPFGASVVPVVAPAAGAVSAAPEFLSVVPGCCPITTVVTVAVNPTAASTKPAIANFRINIICSLKKVFLIFSARTA